MFLLRSTFEFPTFGVSRHPYSTHVVFYLQFYFVDFLLHFFSFFCLTYYASSSHFYVLGFLPRDTMLSTSSIAFSKGPHFDAFACCSFLSPEEALTQAATCDANKRADKSYMQVNGDSPHVSHQRLHVVTYIHLFISI